MSLDNPSRTKLVTSDDPVRLSAIIDERPLNRFHLLVLMLCGFVMFLDGFDTQAISFAAPVLAREWGLTPAQLGPLLSSAIFGLMVGYLLLSPLATRFGHRRVIILTTAVFGALTLLCSVAPGPTELLVLRFITGMGLGAAIPSVVALTSEFAPRRRRSSFVMFIYCWLALGFVAAGVVSGFVIPLFGWRAMFVVGGTLPLVLAIALLRFLPESPRHLLAQSGDQRRLRAILRRLDPTLSPTLVVAPDPDDGSQTQKAIGLVVELLRRRWIASTLLLWVAFIANLAAFYSIQSWLPSIVGSLGQPQPVIIGATILTTIGGIIAATVIGPSMDRISPFRTLGVVYLLGAVFVAVLGMVLGGSTWILLVAAFLSGTCVTGGQMSIVAVASLIYPPRLRSTGVGWALGIGRVGGIIGPILVGVALGAGVAPSAVFLVIGVVLILAGVSVLLLGRQNRVAT